MPLTNEENTDLPDEERDVNSSAQENNISNIASSQESLSQIKKNLEGIINTFNYNKSLVSKAAKFWGRLPLWLKIIGGIILTVPTLVAGIVTHIGILLIITAFTAVAYTLSGMVLDDYYDATQIILSRLKKGIFHLASLLETTILALDKIRENLFNEIDRFKNENLNLVNNINYLNKQVDSLESQIINLGTTEESLRNSSLQLTLSNENLRTSLEENDRLIKANHEEIIALKIAYEQANDLLNIKIEELTEAGKQIQKTKEVAKTLQSTVDALSATVIEDEKKNNKFKTGLHDYLSQEKTNFGKLAEGFSEERKQLKEDLGKANDRYIELLKRHELLVNRLEQLEIRTPAAINDYLKPISVGELGFYGEKSSHNAKEKILELTANAT